MDSHSLSERWSVLIAAVESLAKARDFDTVRDVIRATARTIADAQGITIVVRDGDYCHYVAEDAISPLWTGQRFKLDSCVSGIAMRTGETIIIPDIYADARVPHEAYRPTFVKSMVMTPIGEAESNAAIGAYWNREHTPDETALRLLETLARSTATALDNIHLNQARRRVEAELLQQTEALEIVNRTGIAVAAERDLDAVVQLITDAGVELTGAQFGAFFYNIFNEQGESYMLYGLSGVPREVFEKFPMPRNTGVFAPTFAGAGIVRSDDIRADPRYGRNAPHQGMPKGHLPVTSYLAVPVISRSGEVHGGLFFGHEVAAQFEPRHEELILGLASHAAIAIDNAQLDEDARREIAARRMIAEHLRESNDRFRAAVDAVQGVLWTNNAAGEMEGEQTSWSALTGQTQAEYSGYGWANALHPDDVQPSIEAWQAAVAGRKLFVFEHRVRGRDGVWRHYAVRAIPIFNAEGQVLQWVGVHTDITEQRDYEDAIRDLNITLERRVAQAIAERETVEEVLRQAQKMEAVGHLTGGIAHDFNNLLTIIMGNMDMAVRNLGDQAPPRVANALANAQRGAERAATLTQRLLAFARRQPLAPKPTDVGKLIAGMSELLTRALGETIAIETVVGAGLWRVEVDPNQLESTIINLAVNARDAMSGSGRLTIESQNAVIDRDYAVIHTEVAPGPYVVVAVTDTGSGMSAETLARAFDPFFTTKEVGKGTGLGLSQVYGFVKQSGGHVKIYSEPDQGTTIKLYLPRLMISTDVEEEAVPVAVDTGGHTETVLVVEDDEDVRIYAVESLRELGYDVLDAHDGPTALKLLEKRAAPIDLLFTDIVMPGMTGRELANAARVLQPGLRTLYSSGYTRNAIMHGGRLDQGVEFLPKPFTFSTLTQRVREVLDKRELDRILLVDGNDGQRLSVLELARGLGFSAEQAASAREAITKLRTSEGRFDAVVIDADVANGSLADFIAELHAVREDLPVLLMAEGEELARLTALYADYRCVAVLAKPFDGQGLRGCLMDLDVNCRAGNDL